MRENPASAKRESKTVDFKTAFDPDRASDWCELIKDMVAVANSGGGTILTAPGIPMIFQGQEFLEDRYFRDSAPLDWAKLDTYAGINALYRDLIRLRRNWFDQTRGLL